LDDYRWKSITFVDIWLFHLAIIAKRRVNLSVPLQDGVAGTLFTKEECVSLKGEYGFAEDYDLYSELNNALAWYPLAKQSHMRTGPRQDREMLTFLHQSAAESAQLLEYLSPSQEAMLADADECLDIPALRRLVATIRTLEEACRRSLNVIPPGAVVRKSDWRKAVIEELRRIYCEGTGKEDRYTFNPYTGSFSGEFFTFVGACFVRLEIDIADATLAGDITKTLR
jgi:hypothetical protein